MLLCVCQCLRQKNFAPQGGGAYESLWLSNIRVQSDLHRLAVSARRDYACKKSVRFFATHIDIRKWGCYTKCTNNICSAKKHLHF